MDVPTLTDGVVTLGAPDENEIDLHLAGEDEETARRFGWWPDRSTEDSVRRAYRRWVDDWARGGPTFTFATREVDTGRLVGGCELRRHGDPAGHDRDSAEVSYWTHADRRGRGFGARSLRLVLRFAPTVGITQVESHVAPDNAASLALSRSAGLAPVGQVLNDGMLMVRLIRVLDG